MLKRLFKKRLARKIEIQNPPFPTGDPKETRKRNRVILKAILIGGLSVDVILGIILLYVAFLVPSFRLEQVDVTGNARLSKDEIIHISEIELGANLLAINLSMVADRLRKNPWICSASVYRRFPGKILIEVEEKKPKAILVSDSLYYVDDKAEFFTRLRPGDSVDYPLFTGMKLDELDSRRGEIKDTIRAGLSLVELVNQQATPLKISGIAEILANPDYGLTVRTKGGRLIILGRDKFHLKLKRYAQLKKFLIRRGQWHQARVIDLDLEDRALVRTGKPRHQG